MIKILITSMLPALFIYAAYTYGWTITTINVISGIVAVTLGSGLAIAGAMANDSGRGGGFIHGFQFLSITYPLIYLIGLIGSITVSYSNYESREIIATGLGLVSLAWLELIALLLLAGIAVESAERSRRERTREKEIAAQRKPYLVHLPHCGTMIPDEYLGDYFLDRDELQRNVVEYADLYTDELFAPLLERFGGVKSNYSRLFFDPERFFDDGHEVMSRKGLGWFYERAILEDKPLRHTDNKGRVAEYYHRHHNELNRMTQEKLDLYGRCTIIDCHSFSNQRYWFHDPDIELPDICIGYDEEYADMELVELLKTAFANYTVAINSPYSGSMVPTAFYGKGKGVKSVMLEINKKLYLDSDNNKSNDYKVILNILEMVMNQLIFEENYKANEYATQPSN